MRATDAEGGLWSICIRWPALAILVAAPVSVWADYCCTTPDFGNDNSAPELSECRQVVFALIIQLAYRLVDVSRQVCRAFVPYGSVQACSMNRTCSNVMRDYNQAYKLANQVHR